MIAKQIDASLVWGLLLVRTNSGSPCPSRWSNILSLGRRPSNWRVLSHFTSNQGLLNCHFFRKLLQWVLSFKLFQLLRSVNVQELVNWKITSSHSDVYFVLINSNTKSFATELINALWLTHEHNLQLWSLGVVVYIFCKLLVNLVITNWNINCDPLLQVNYVLFESLDFSLCLLELFEQFQSRLVSPMSFLFLLQQIVTGCLQLLLHFLLWGMQLLYQFVSFL